MKTSSTRFRHLTDSGLEYTVLKGSAGDVRIGDIVLDGIAWVRGITTELGVTASGLTFDLEAWTGDPEIQGVTGQLSLEVAFPMKFVRPTAYGAPVVTDPAYDIATSQAGSTRSLAIADIKVGDALIFYGETEEVREVYETGLIVFVGGTAYQSRPDLLWFAA